MREALLAFATSLDNDSNYLLEPSTDYRGGPPRPAGSADASNRCVVSHITRDYEITDPVTCRFRYPNPPGCPPLPNVRMHDRDLPCR